MKTYPRVTRAMLSTPWAMLKTKLADVEAFLARVNLEGPLTPEAVAERYGSSEARPLIKVGSVAVIPVQGVISQKINMVDNLSGPGGPSAPSSWTSTLPAGACSASRSSTTSSSPLAPRSASSPA
jgi:hypothetical protein